MNKENAGILKAYCLLIMMLAVLILPVDAAAALDIHDITISEVEYRLDGAPGADPYEFYCFVRGNDITAVTVTAPSGVVYNLAPWPTSQYDWELCLDDLTLAEIQADFPRGPTANYILTFNGGADSVELIHNPTLPGGFANITYPAHNSYNIPLNPTITWDLSVGYGDVLNTALFEDVSDIMVDTQWRIPFGTTTWTVGPLNSGLWHWLEVSVYTGTTPSAQNTAGSDAFDYYNIYENCNEVDFTTIPAIGTLSGWIFIPPDVPDIGYSLEEGDLLYFYSSEPVLNYNITAGEWNTEGPKGLVYVNWPFIYESDPGDLWFALPPVSGLWVYHFSTSQWEVLPRIIPW